MLAQKATARFLWRHGFHADGAHGLLFIHRSCGTNFLEYILDEFPHSLLIVLLRGHLRAGRTHHWLWQGQDGEAQPDDLASHNSFVEAASAGAASVDEPATAKSAGPGFALASVTTVEAMVPVGSEASVGVVLDVDQGGDVLKLICVAGFATTFSSLSMARAARGSNNTSNIERRRGCRLPVEA